RAGEVQPWLVLANLLGAGQLDEALAALDRAAQIDPRNTDIYDLRAELLTRARRFDEALEACRPALFAPHPPLPLAGRSAWVLHMRGDIAEAIRAMQQIVAEN